MEAFSRLLEASELNGTSVVVPVKSVRVWHAENIERNAWFSEPANATQIQSAGVIHMPGLFRVVSLSAFAFCGVRVSWHAIHDPVFEPDDG